MGGRMQTLKESQKSVEAHRQESGPRRERRDQWVTKDAACQHLGRNAIVRGSVGGGEWVIQYMDGDEERARVDVGSLVRRFTSQTVGFMPPSASRVKGAQRVENNEEMDA